MTTLIVLSTAAAPLLAIVGLFRLVGGIRGRRRRCIARQIALTDEIHRELGAAAAPFVHQRGRSGWLVRVAVPLDSPPTVAAIVGIIQAFVFAMLTLVFGVLAVSAHEEHEDHDVDAHGEHAVAAPLRALPRPRFTSAPRWCLTGWTKEVRRWRR